MSTTVEVLRKARELYAQAPSHAPSGEWPAEGTYCVSTAIGTAGGASKAMLDAHDFFEGVIGTPLIPEWNAESSTETVLAAFDRAIKNKERA